MEIEENNLGLRSFTENNEIPLMEDGTDSLIAYDNFLSDEYEAPENPAPIAADQNQNQENEINFDSNPAEVKPAEEKPEDQNQIDFGDNNSDPANEFKVDDAIKQLQSMGYNISQEQDPLRVKEHEITQLDSIIANMTNALEESDEVLCRESVYEELAKQYKREGRQNEIGGESFKLEVEAGMEEFKYSDRLMKLQANATRNLIKSFINEKTQEKEKIKSEVTQAREKEINENRTALKSTFTKYNNQKLFGQSVDQGTLIKAYQSITSGNFTKEIETNKDLQAEFAIYLQLRSNLQQSGGGTYGEGVAAAVNALNGKTQPTPSSLMNTVSRPGAGGIADRIARWGNIGKVDKTPQK